MPININGYSAKKKKKMISSIWQEYHSGQWSNWKNNVTAIDHLKENLAMEPEGISPIS